MSTIPTHDLAHKHDDIRDHAIATEKRQREERAMARAEQERRERENAASRAAEDGTAPTVLGRTFFRQGSGLVEFLLVDRQPTPVRVIIARGQVVDPVMLTGSLRSIAATLGEYSGFQHAEGRFWKLGLVDPFGGGVGLTLPEDLAPVGSPLYATPIDVVHEPTDEERAVALELALDAIEHIDLTKARARDLAETLRGAIAAGPHAIDALALALEERGRPVQPSAPKNDEPTPGA